VPDIERKGGQLPDRIDYGRDQVPDWIREVIETGLAIEREDARSSGSLGFMTRALVSASMPYKDPKTKFFERQNGDLTLTMLSPKGVPYGKYPRLLLSWLITEAVTTRSPVVTLGDTLAEFLRATIGVEATGGKRGTATRVSEQMERLFKSLISVDRRDQPDARSFSFENITLVRGGTIDQEDMRRLDSLDAIENTGDVAGQHLWRAADRTSEQGRWNSQVELTPQFFRECIETPVPLDLRAYRALSPSPMAMDIYSWCTYRMSYIKRPTRPIPWPILQAQFGSGFPFTEQGTRDFKKAFKRNLDIVRLTYPDLRVDETSDRGGLILMPSRPHVPKLGKPGQGRLF
jgi:Plasmid encoded RepA protein.